MNNLADALLNYLLAILIRKVGNVDDDVLHEWEDLPDHLGKLDPEERTALSQAAQRKLDYFARPPDEHGYKPHITSDEADFLRELATGELYDVLEKRNNGLT